MFPLTGCRAFLDYRLHQAVKSNSIDKAKLLLSDGADVNAPEPISFSALGNLKRPPIIIAAGKGYDQMTRILLEHGALVDGRSKHRFTALIQAAAEGHFSIVGALLQARADINASDQWQQTALIWAAKNGHLAIVKLLVTRGAKTQLKQKDGKTALDLARERKRLKVIELLD